jgi:hypothetical protein
MNLITLNTTQLTNTEIHNIKRLDIVNFTRAINFTFIQFFERLDPEHAFEISRLIKQLLNMTSVYDLEYTICAFLCTKNYNELFSAIYRTIIPIGSPIELNAMVSYGIIEEYVSGYRFPCNIMSSRRLLNKNKRYLYINGMGVDINIHKNNVKFIEKMFNISCDGVYNPTHSVFIDTATMITQYISATSKSMLFECIMNYIYSVADEDEIVIIAHSKGTITIGYVVFFIIYNIIIPGYLKNATPEKYLVAVRSINILKKMRIYAISNCAISNDFLKIGDKYYPEFNSFCNLGDPVPRFGRLGDVYLQYYTDMERIDKLTENNIHDITYDEISNIVSPEGTRDNTSYLDNLYTLDKNGHLLESYIFEKNGSISDYVYEILSRRELQI